MTKLSKPKYLDKVNHLSEEEKERLLYRMAGKLPRRVEKEKISQVEALAIQMELEDEHLQEWRKMMQSLKKKDEAKAAEKAKAAKKAKPAEGAKSVEKAKPAEKAKAAVVKKADEKVKVAKKAKTPEKAKVEPGK